MRSRFPIVHLTSVALFALLCAILAWWALQLLTPQPPVAPAGAVARSQAPVDLAQAGRLFGGATPTATAVKGGGDIRVTGVVAAGERGVALLSVDGRPAKAFGVGQQVTDGVRLVAVEPSIVRLSQGGTVRELEAPARGSVAVLTSGPARGAPAAPMAPGTSPPPVAPNAMPLAAPGAMPGSGGQPARAVPGIPTAPGTVTPATAIDASGAGASGSADGSGPPMQPVPPTPVQPGPSNQ